MKKNGFTLLFAVLIISITLSLSLGATNLVISQLTISRDTRESLEAFYTANAGAECALFWDIQYKFDGPDKVSAFDPLNPAATEIECNDSDPENPHFFVGGPPSCIDCVDSSCVASACVDGRTIFEFEANNRCVQVTVEKLRSVGETRVVSRGRNHDCPFSTTLAGSFERILRATYGISAASRATIFYDSFGSGSTDTTFNEDPDIGTGGWLEGGAGAEKRVIGGGNDTASPDGGRFATIFSADGGGNNGWICRTIDASAYNALELSYYWRGDSDAEIDDRGVVEYKLSGACSDGNDGGGWTNLQTHNMQGTDGAWTTQSTFSLPTNTDSASFLFRLRSHEGEIGEDFRIDGVRITAVPN